MDKFGFKQTLTFNKHHHIPFLTNGWFTLLQHYNIDQPREINFAYFGNGSFLITVGRVYASTDEYPSFHSYSTKPNVTTHFDITLTKYEATSSQLVNLHLQLSSFVLIYDFQMFISFFDQIYLLAISFYCHRPCIKHLPILSDPHKATMFSYVTNILMLFLLSFSLGIRPK
jgi:hypothetical protein